MITSNMPGLSAADKKKTFPFQVHFKFMYFLGKWEGAYVLLHHPNKKTLQKFCPHEIKMGEYFFKKHALLPATSPAPKIKTKSRGSRTRPGGSAGVSRRPGGLGAPALRPPPRPAGVPGGGCFSLARGGAGRGRRGAGRGGCAQRRESPSPGHFIPGATEMKPAAPATLFSCRAPNYASTRSSRFPGAALGEK